MDRDSWDPVEARQASARDGHGDRDVRPVAILDPCDHPSVRDPMVFCRVLRDSHRRGSLRRRRGHHVHLVHGKPPS